MRISVGSKNPAKIAGVTAGFRMYDFPIEITGCSVESGVSKQPFSLDEIIKGARNRSIRAFSAVPNCGLGIGVESGIFYQSDKYLDTCHIAMWDGSEWHEGGSMYFEIPKRLVDKIKATSGELGDHFDKSGMGAIGHYTNGIVPRDQQIQYATMMAIGKFIHREEFK